MSKMTVRGTVRGGAIWLEEAVPSLEGKVVEVQLEVVEEPQLLLTPEAQRQAWNAWIERGPQGPIDINDVDDEDWP